MSTFGTWSLAEPNLSLLLSDEFKKNKVHAFMKQFFINDEDINELKRLFDKEMDDGLKTDSTADLTDVSRMGMNVTYFTELFDGTENGDFVVMNLNSQNLIIALATVKPGFPVKTVRMYFTVDEAIRRTPYIKIFEYLFECLLKFFTENNLLQKRQTLGFCTELPMIQFDIDSAIISYFTTAASEFPLNFYDIRKCFQTVSLKECYKELNFDLVAIMNTNMSLMIHSSYMYGHIDAFLNLDDDCDLIYEEDVTNVPKWEPTHSRTKHIFIDTELRNFGKSGTLDFITTNLDWSVISEPFSQTHTGKGCRLLQFLSEKYIRELIRHILVSLHHDLVYCREGDVGNLYKVNGISLSSILNFMNTEDVNHALQILPGETIGKKQDDVLVAKYVCKIVFIRVALLTAICISIVFNRRNKHDFILAIKSPLLDKYVDFEMYVRKFMEILAPTKKFQIILTTEDASIEGTALGTSIIKRQKMK